MTTHKQVITLAKECFYCYEDAKGRPEYSANEYALERFYAIAFDAGRVAERESKLSDHIKREVLLRDWIRQQGEVTNTCTFNILKEVGNECACHRAKEQR
ncbi:MAG: hypothetical protein IPG22_06275 [Acidobacteria bacterium]|nr:hypothetical protein [Acidobacteriota bacterium]